MMKKKIKLILCPLRENDMRLSEDVMAKLDVEPGDIISIGEKNGVIVLYNPSKISIDDINI